MPLLLLSLVPSGLDSAAFILLCTGLAVTPFIALIHISRMAKGFAYSVARLVFLTVMMAVPTFIFFAVGSDFGGGAEAFLLVLTPGILSLWLSVFFGVAAMQRSRRTSE